MPNKTTHPHSVPTTLQGKTQKGFEGGKDKVLELLNTLELDDFLKQFTQQVLPLKSLNWFSLDCAKFVLPIFEELLPNDKRVRKCIEINERYLNGKSNLKELAAAAAAAYSARFDADNYNAHTAACAAYAAFDAADLDACAAYFFAAPTINPAIAAAFSAFSAFSASKDEMQAFIKNWIDNYFNI